MLTSDNESEEYTPRSPLFDPFNNYQESPADSEEQANFKKSFAGNPEEVGDKIFTDEDEALAEIEKLKSQLEVLNNEIAEKKRKTIDLTAETQSNPQITEKRFKIDKNRSKTSSHTNINKTNSNHRKIETNLKISIQNNKQKEETIEIGDSKTKFSIRQHNSYQQNRVIKLLEDAVKSRQSPLIIESIASVANSFNSTIQASNPHKKNQNKSKHLSPSRIRYLISKGVLTADFKNNK